MNQQKPPKEKSPYSTYVRYSGIAIQMIAVIGLGSYGGLKLDEIYPNDYHAYTLICSLASVAIAMYLLIHQVSGSSKN